MLIGPPMSQTSLFSLFINTFLYPLCTHVLKLGYPAVYLCKLYKKKKTKKHLLDCHWLKCGTGLPVVSPVRERKEAAIGWYYPIHLAVRINIKFEHFLLFSEVQAEANLKNHPHQLPRTRRKHLKKKPKNGNMLRNIRKISRNTSFYHWRNTQYLERNLYLRL